jgi:O-Antigen ligase
VGGVHVSAASSSFDLAHQIASRSHAVPLLQLFALTVMVIPSDTVIKAIGAGGYPAGLVGMFAFAAFLAATILGLHNPLRHRHPVRSVICLLWIAALASYVLMDRSSMSVIEMAGADRLLMQLVVITGIALVAAECLTSLHDVRRVLRALVWGGAFCGAVAALQFWISLDLAPYLRELPGFSLNFENAGILDRAALNRVAGTAIHPIELGVVAGMLLPLAIHLAIYDTERSPRARWAPVVLIGIAIPTSVSRSAILSVALALAVFVVLMPSPQRLVGLCGVPFALCAVFMSAPGIIGTLTSFFQAGTSDPSVATRVDDYPMAERLVQQAPWFGHGPGTYIPDNAFDIFDNQYLKTAVELGLVGLVALVAYLALPVIFALVARRHSRDPELRMLCAALAGAALAATVCSFTFDSLSFPMFSNVSALVIGLIGACWRLASASRAPAPADVHGGAIATYLESGEPASNTRTVLSAGG